MCFSPRWPQKLPSHIDGVCVSTPFRARVMYVCVCVRMCVYANSLHDAWAVHMLSALLKILGLLLLVVPCLYVLFKTVTAMSLDSFTAREEEEEEEENVNKTKKSHLR